MARQYCGALGKAVPARVPDDTTTTDTREAAEIRLRGDRCKIPDDARHREKWRLALDMLDEGLSPETEPETAGGWVWRRTRWWRTPAVGDATGFRLGLAERCLPYVVAVKPTTSAHPADAMPESLPYVPGKGRPPCYRYAPTNLKALVLTAERRAGCRPRCSDPANSGETTVDEATITWHGHSGPVQSDP